MVSPERIDVLQLSQNVLAPGLYRIAGGTPLPTRRRMLPEIDLNHTSADCLEEGGKDLSLAPGDVVRINHRGVLRVVLSARANTNSLLVTENCDNACVFCSQPPKDVDDRYLYEQAILALASYDAQPEELVGITGGEPTLDKPVFLRFLSILNELEVDTALHVLTNGRALSDRGFVESIARSTMRRRIVWGVPLYGSSEAVHDTAVGSTGAFVETVAGLQVASQFGLEIELRVVPTTLNIENLALLATSIGYMVPKPSCVSVMQLEPVGWARANYGELFIDTPSQVSALSDLRETLIQKRIPVRFFNYPLCQLPVSLREDAVSSISDWKNYFPDECDRCRKRESCGGFFVSAQGKFREAVEPI